MGQLDRLWLHRHVVEQPKLSGVVEGLGGGPGLGQDLHGLLEPPAGLIHGDVQLVELTPLKAPSYAEIHPAERWSINLDADYTRSEHNNYSLSIFGATFADQELDLTGKLPSVISHKPNTLSASWAQPANTILAGETDAQYFADPRAQYWRAAMDHSEDSVGQEYQFKAELNQKKIL